MAEVAGVRRGKQLELGRSMATPEEMWVVRLDFLNTQRFITARVVRCCGLFCCWVGGGGK